MSSKLHKKIKFGGIVNKTPDKDSFESVMLMINNPRTRITHISYSSLKGFIFKLRIEPENGKADLDECDIEFYGLNENKTAFDAPIDTLVIKMTITHEYKPIELTKYIDINNDYSVNKVSDTYDEFFKEAVVQSEIYDITVSKGEPICPALVNFSYFDNMEDSDSFLNLCNEKCEDDESKQMIKYIKTELNRIDDCNLGIIFMESAVEFESLYNIEKNMDDIELRELHIDVMIQVIRLLNETEYVHCDFHANNCMVKRNDDGSFKVYIIDFGRIINVTTIPIDYQKIVLKKAIEKFPNSPLIIEQNGQLTLSPKFNIHITQFTDDLVHILLLFIASVEYMYFHLEFLSNKSNIDQHFLKRYIGDNYFFYKIAESLNIYYNLASYPKQYAKLDKNKIYVRTIDDLNPNKICTLPIRKLPKLQPNMMMPPSSPSDISSTDGSSVVSRTDGSSVVSRPYGTPIGFSPEPVIGSPLPKGSPMNMIKQRNAPRSVERKKKNPNRPSFYGGSKSKSKKNKSKSKMRKSRKCKI